MRLFLWWLFDYVPRLQAQRAPKEKAMSGKPSPSGVSGFRITLKRMTEAEQRWQRAEQDKNEAANRADLACKEYHQQREELFKMMEQMDVYSSGNAGYQSRMSWFLAEMHRQTESDLSSARAVPET